MEGKGEHHFMRLPPVVLLALVFSCSLFGQTYQTYTISTFAGGAAPLNIPGTSASIASPQAVAIDSTGGLLIVSQNTVLRMDPTTGLMGLIAGNETFGYTGDNASATLCQLAFPHGIAMDS